MSDEPKVEAVFAELDIDPARYTPGYVNFKMIKITNALMDLYRQRGENQKSITEMGTRSGPQYKEVRGRQYLVEDQIRALELKHATLTSVNYNNNAEMKHLTK